MKRWVVTAGDFASNVGKVLEVRWDRGERLSVEQRVAFVPSQTRSVPGKGFTGACWYQRDLIVCCFNMLMRVNLSAGTAVPWLVRDDFNDLHAVDLSLSANGSFRQVLVANTGVDRIDWFRADHSLEKSLSLEPRPGIRPSEFDDPYFANQKEDTPFWQQRLRDDVHPNAVRHTERGVWVSRFADRSLERIQEGVRTHVSVPGCPHDLVIENSNLYCTTTDGCVWQIATEHAEPSPSLFLDTYSVSGWSGWCRGLAMDNDTVLVGLTHITSVPTDRWCDRPVRGTKTALLLFDRIHGQLLAARSLDDFGVQPKVFAILSFKEGTYER